jgi:membrane associated rhomboid family serine protease
MMEDQEELDLSVKKDSGNSRYILVWTILFILGMLVEFFARFFGYENNPLSFYHPLIPSLTGMSAAVIVLLGYFILASEKAKKETMTRRNGVMVIVLGVLMLFCFFIFKGIIPLVFG